MKVYQMSACKGGRVPLSTCFISESILRIYIKFGYSLSTLHNLSYSYGIVNYLLNEACRQKAICVCVPLK